jgi:hypothetical protein
MTDVPKRKLRIIVRQYTPLKPPFLVSMLKVREFIEQSYPKLNAVVYIGWVRRRDLGRKSLRYMATTAEKAGIARKRLKTSVNFGEDIWDLSPY